MNFNSIPEEIRSEFQINENGQAFASRRAIARLAGVSDAAVCRLLEKMQTEDSPLIFVEADVQNYVKEGLVLINLVELILYYYGFCCQLRYRSQLAAYNYSLLKGNPTLAFDVAAKKKGFVGREKLVQRKLSNLLNGTIEVNTLGGKIDILTSKEIIEVKSVNEWKSALGQVLVYGYYYPSHQKRVHLYGETQESYLNMIKEHCQRFNIIVTWER